MHAYMHTHTLTRTSGLGPLSDTWSKATTSVTLSPSVVSEELAHAPPEHSACARPCSRPLMAPSCRCCGDGGSSSAPSTIRHVPKKLLGAVCCPEPASWNTKPVQQVVSEHALAHSSHVATPNFSRTVSGGARLPSGNLSKSALTNTVTSSLPSSCPYC